MTPSLTLGAVAVAVGAAGAWTVQSWRYDAKISDIDRTHSAAIAQAQETHIKALENAREQSEKYQQDAHQAAADAAIRISAADRDLHRNRTELDRMRDAIRSRPVATCAMPNVATAASVEPADTVGNVLAECAAAIAELARAADGHASDAMMCFAAWPKK